MTFIYYLFALLLPTFAFAQSLPIDFEQGVITTSDFIDFDGGTATVIANPQAKGINNSSTVAQIIRNGGQVWAGSKIVLSNNLDFSTDGIISMKVFTAAPVGTVVKFKLEGGDIYELDQLTTVTNEWETLSWDFTGLQGNYNTLVFMFDFGNVGNGLATSVFLFDDISLSFGGTQIDLPVTFEDSGVNYNMTDFGGTHSSLAVDPMDPNNHVIKVVKTNTAATWAGTTISTPAGFASAIPLSLSSSTMYVRVWSPTASIPIRLKVEDANDPTHTCETEAITTKAGDWELLTFDFSKEVTGTATLATGLSNGWVYNMASIFFNFGTDGATAGEQTYYFDNVAFGKAITGIQAMPTVAAHIYPNPANSHWIIETEEVITQLILTNLSGQQIMIQSPFQNQVLIDGAILSPGMYIARFTTPRGIGKAILVRQ